MYSDYASGIAFLIKTNSSIKGWCHDQHPVCGALAWEAALSTAPLWKLPGTMMEEFEASQAAGVSDRKRRGQSESKLIVAMLGDVFRRLSEKIQVSSLFVSANPAASPRHIFSRILCNSIYFFKLYFSAFIAVCQLQWRDKDDGCASEMERCCSCQLRMRRPNQRGYAAIPII